MASASWRYVVTVVVARLFILRHGDAAPSASDGRTIVGGVGIVIGTASSPPRRVIVVGGGVGGLAVAARIASSVGPVTGTGAGAGVEVILLEKNSPEMLGGRCGSFDVTVPGLKGVGISGDDGGGDRGSGSVGGEGTGEGVGPQSSFRHERGPSLLLLKSEYETLFRDCGRTAEEYGLNMVQCDPAYQVVFHDGESIELGFARDKNRDAAAAMAEGERKSRSIMDGFERDGAAKWDEYMKVCFSLPSLFFISSQLDIIPTDSPLLPSWEIIVWPLRPPLRYIIAFLPPLPDFFGGISTIGSAGGKGKSAIEGPYLY